MNETAEETVVEKKVFSAELALVLGLVCNSVCVTLINKSLFGTTVVSSVPYVLNLIFPKISFGMCNYLIQCLTILALILLTRTFKKSYVGSFIMAFIFGLLLDFFEFILTPLPVSIPFRVAYYVIGFFAMSFGICMLIRCGLPVLPFDTFTRDFSSYFNVPVGKVKTVFDLSCLTISLILCFFVLHQLGGIGVGTAVSAVFTGFLISVVCHKIDARYRFEPTLLNKISLRR